MERNGLFVQTVVGLTKEGKTNKEVSAICCPMFGIDDHTFRAWKHRLKKQFPELVLNGCFVVRASKTKPEDLPVIIPVPDLDLDTSSLHMTNKV